MKNAGMMVVVCMMAMEGVASAEIIQGIDIDFVIIGNAGNAVAPIGHGAVAYAYNIGKYEVTNEQWNAFTARPRRGDIGKETPLNYLTESHRIALTGTLRS